MSLHDLRQDFPLLEREIDGRGIHYLDSAATALKCRAAIGAVDHFYRHSTSNVHRAVHLLAEESTEDYEGTREDLAVWIGAAADEIVFTGGTTAGANLVRNGLGAGQRTLSSLADHHSLLVPFGLAEGGSVVGVHGDGEIDLDDLDRKLACGIDIVAISDTGNAWGTLQPVREVIERAHGHGARVLVDAAQSVPHRRLDVRELGADYVVFSAHKMFAPSGVGCLWARRELLAGLAPAQWGGHMVDEVHADGFTLDTGPARLEAGTPPIESVIGWGAAIRYLESIDFDTVEQHDHELARAAAEGLRAIGAVQIVGPEDGRRGAAVAFRLRGLESHGAARMLAQRDAVFLRSGFHCAQPLHEHEGGGPTLRASFALYNTLDDVEALVRAVERIASIL